MGGRGDGRERCRDAGGCEQYLGRDGWLRPAPRPAPTPTKNRSKIVKRSGSCPWRSPTTTNFFLGTGIWEQETSKEVGIGQWMWNRAKQKRAHRLINTKPCQEASAKGPWSGRLRMLCINTTKPSRFSPCLAPVPYLNGLNTRYVSVF